MRTDFKLPPSVIDRQFKRMAWFLAIGVVVSHFIIARGGLMSVLGTATLVIAVFVAAYFIAKRHVWVSLSSAGLAGTGYTGRTVSIAWAEPTTVARSFNSGMKGVEVRAIQNDGLLRSKVLSLFVPEPILASAEFRAELGRLAPAGHPLRAYAA